MKPPDYSPASSARSLRMSVGCLNNLERSVEALHSAGVPAYANVAEWRADIAAHRQKLHDLYGQARSIGPPEVFDALFGDGEKKLLVAMVLAESRS